MALVIYEKLGARVFSCVGSRHSNRVSPLSIVPQQESGIHDSFLWIELCLQNSLQSLRRWSCLLSPNIAQMVDRSIFIRSSSNKISMKDDGFFLKKETLDVSSRWLQGFLISFWGGLVIGWWEGVSNLISGLGGWTPIKDDLLLSRNDTLRDGRQWSLHGLSVELFNWSSLFFGVNAFLTLPSKRPLLLLWVMSSHSHLDPNYVTLWLLCCTVLQARNDSLSYYMTVVKLILILGTLFAFLLRCGGISWRWHARK